MEDKNIIINDTKYNFFKFYNVNQPLTELKYFNSERLVFAKPAARKLPETNISFNRIFVAITGPKSRIVTDGLKGVYDVNELLDYDSSLTKGSEFTAKYDFTKLEEADYHIYHYGFLIDLKKGHLIDQETKLHSTTGFLQQDCYGFIYLDHVRRPLSML